MINQTAPDTTDEVEETLNAEQLSEIKRRSVRGAVSFIARTALLQGIGLASMLVLGAYLSEVDFGIYGFVTQIIGLLIFFSDVGLAAALVQKKDQPTLTDYRTAFTIQQILSWIIVGIVCLILATGLVQEKTGDVGAWILVALAISFPLASFKTISSIMLERELQFSKLVIPQIIEQLVFHGILIFLAIQEYGAMAYAYAITARSVLGSLSMWLIQPWSLGLSLNKTSIKGLLGFGAKFQLNDFLARIKDQLFFLVLGGVMPLNEFGYIQWSKIWSMYPYNLTVQNVMAITFPTFARLQGNKIALQKAIEKTLFFISLAIFPLIAGMSVFIWPLTQVVDKYDKWEPAVMTFIYFTLSIGWAAISTPLTNTLNALGKINTTLKLMSLWTILTWVITPIALWQFGYEGVALAALIISFTSFLPIVYVKKIVPIRVWDQVWRQLAASLVMVGVGVVGLSYWSQNLYWFIAGMVITGSVYGIALMVIGWRKVLAEVASLRR
jgi:O-antigen/teichoic acid export membrane protein